MNSKPGSRYAAAFDDMLADSRKRFEALTGGAGADDTRIRLDGPLASPAGDQTPDKNAVHDVGTSQGARALDAKFAGRWRYDIVDRRRDGDEVVVWGRLVVKDQGIDKTRRARARIHRPAGGGAIEGSADGASFSLRRDEDQPAGTDGDPEDLAFREAAEAALAIALKGVV